jgi:hypothetical protein
MKIIITHSQLMNIIEGEFNFHFTGGKVLTDKPYGSENLVRMDGGRHTGHFGSGLYFSTFNYLEKYDSLDKYRGMENISPELLNIDKDKGIYRVDLDIYRNLYRVQSNEHGDFLFETLKQCNRLFYAYTDYYNKNYPLEKLDLNFGKQYLIIKNNLEKIGLRVPSYKEFIKMTIQTGKDLANMHSFDKSEDNIIDRRSFSTRIMEYNGYNGVNVSGIQKYDNTQHGSVIYDVSKISDKIKPINLQLYGNRIEKGVIDDFANSSDLRKKVLKGAEILLGDIKNASDNDKLLLIKRYDKYLEPYHIEELDDKFKKLYYRFLWKKLKEKYIDITPSDKIIEDIIENGFVKMIYDPQIYFDEDENNTLLYNALNKYWGYDEKNLEILIDNIDRELNEDEEIIYNEIKDDLYKYEFENFVD